ncbi:hypothetical protein BDC45DRAFT_539280 [Circinella umbellata]|nr:hypothetical protein BDC45DRAFT_539280 [Circinella umbellata]
MKMMMIIGTKHLLLRGSPVCVFFLRLLWRFFYVCFCACNGNGIILFVLLVCRLGIRWSVCLDAFVLRFDDTNSTMQFAFLGNGRQEGITVDGLIGIKGEKDELLYTPTSFLVSLGEQDEAYLEHQQISCSRRFLFLMTYKTHLILYYFTILKLGSSFCQEGAYCNCVGNHGTLWEGVLCVLIGLSKLEESVVSISLMIWKRNMECTRCEWSFLVTTDFDPIQCFGNSRLPWFFVNDVVVTTDFDPNYG